MKLIRILSVTVIALLGSVWAKADTIPGHFEINLNDFFGTTDFGGWGSGNLFNDQVNTGTSSEGFTQNDLCGEFDEGCDIDPYIKLNNGGHSMPFGPSFNADANGGGILDFFNAGPPITDILITTSIIPGGSYHCQSDIFAFCGFQGDGTLSILFTNGSIPTAVPEPVETLLLVAGAGAIAAVHRVRRRKA